eukprot:Skav217235  [mRNA]  locus=scaffold110:129304:130923:- [translate_table: standard]
MKILVQEDEVGIASSTRPMLRVMMRSSFRGSRGGVCSAGRSKDIPGPREQFLGMWKRNMASFTPGISRTSGAPRAAPLALLVERRGVSGGVAANSSCRSSG